MAIATLTVDLVAKLGTIEQDLGRIGQIAQRQADQMERAFSGVRATLAGLGASVSLGGAIAAFKSATDALDRLNDASDATGASIESLSKLEDVARRNGAGIETVENAVLKMNKALASADEEGKGAAAILKAIGLNVEELKRLDPAEALQKIAIAFNGFERNGDLARASQQLFGRSIAETAPLLKDLAEAGDLHASVTAEQAQQAEEFNKALYALQTNVGNVARSIAGDILPSANALVSVFAEASRETVALGAAGKALAQDSAVSTWARASALDLSSLADMIDTTKREFSALASLAKAVASSVAAGTAAIANQPLTAGVLGQEARKSAAAATQAINGVASDPDQATLRERLQMRFSAIADAANSASAAAEKKRLALPSFGAATGGKGRATSSKEDLDYVANARRMAADLDRELAALKRREEELAAPIGNVLQRLREQAQGLRETAQTAGMSEAEIARMTASQIEEAAVLAELNGAYDSQVEALQAVAAGYRDVADASEQKRIADALQDTVTGKLEAQRKEMEFFAEAMERGAISAEQFAEIATAKLGLVGDEAKKTKSIAEELGLTFSSAFEDAIVNGAKFSDVLKAIEKDLIRIVARKAITEPLGNTISGLLGGGTTTGGAAGGILNNLSSLYSAGSKLYDLGAAFFGSGAASSLGSGLTVSGSTLAAFGLGTGAASAAGGIAGGVSGGTGLAVTTTTGTALGTGGAATTGLAGGVGGGTGLTIPVATTTASITSGGAATAGVTGTATGATSGTLAGISSTGWGVIIAAVVAIVLAALPKGGGPKFEGSFDNKNLERFFTKSDADAQSRDVVASIAIGYDQLAKTLGGKADQNIRLAFGFAVDPVGDAPNALHLAVGKQEYIEDRGRPEDLQGQVAETIQRGLLSALKQTDLYDSIDALLAAFDPMTATSAEVAAEMTKITDAMNTLTQQAQDYAVSLGAIGDSMQSTHNMFIDSVRNIRFGNADAAGKYSILDDEAARYRDMLKVLVDPALIGDYSKRLNDTINAAYSLLSPEQQAAQADSFISRLEAADKLAQTQYEKAAEAQKAVYASLPADLRKAVEDGFANLPAAIAAAIPKGLQVDFRANVPGATEVSLIG